EEEEEQIRKGNLPPTPRGDFDKEEAPKKPPTPPDSAEVKEVLQTIVTHILTSKELQHERGFYGTPEGGKFTLVDGSALAWPKSFRPAVPGYVRVVAPRRVCEFDGPQPRLLGISLEKFQLGGAKPGLLDGPIQVTLFNAGGSANGSVLGS